MNLAQEGNKEKFDYKACKQEAIKALQNGKPLERNKGVCAFAQAIGRTRIKWRNVSARSPARPAYVSLNFAKLFF